MGYSVFWPLIFFSAHEREKPVPVEGQLELVPPIREDGDKPRKLYAVPNKQTKPSISIYAIRWVKNKTTKNNLLILQGDLDPGLPRLEDRPLQALDGGVSGRMHANHISTTYSYRYCVKISLLLYVQEVVSLQKRCLIYLYQKMRFTPFINYYNT